MNEFLNKIKEVCNSTIVYWLLIGITVFGVCYGASWLKNRYNSGATAAADVVADQIKSARDRDRAIGQSLLEAETGAGDLSERIGRSQEGVRNAQESTSNIEAAIAEQRRLIGECQQILERLLQGDEGQAGNSKDPA